MRTQQPRARVNKPSDWIALIARHGDRDAFAALFQRFAPKVKSYFLRSGFDDGEAETLAQETLARVWRCADLFDPATCETSSWIYAIARNLRIDSLTKGARQSGPTAFWMRGRATRLRSPPSMMSAGLAARATDPWMEEAGAPSR